MLVGHPQGTSSRVHGALVVASRIETLHAIERHARDLLVGHLRGTSLLDEAATVTTGSNLGILHAIERHARNLRLGHLRDASVLVEAITVTTGSNLGILHAIERHARVLKVGARCVETCRAIERHGGPLLLTPLGRAGNSVHGTIFGASEIRTLHAIERYVRELLLSHASVISSKVDGDTVGTVRVLHAMGHVRHGLLSHIHGSSTLVEGASVDASEVKSPVAIERHVRDALLLPHPGGSSNRVHGAIARASGIPAPYAIPRHQVRALLQTCSHRTIGLQHGILTEARYGITSHAILRHGYTLSLSRVHVALDSEVERDLLLGGRRRRDPLCGLSGLAEGAIASTRSIVGTMRAIERDRLTHPIHPRYGAAGLRGNGLRACAATRHVVLIHGTSTVEMVVGLEEGKR